MTNRRSGECVYCGALGQLTDDHIPPEGLCGKPRPSDLVKVPSCLRCNGGASKDDEYFRTVMVMKAGASSHPEAMTIRPAVFRALEKARKAGFARHIIRSSRPVSLRTPAGLYVGRGFALDVDLARLDRVVSRITKALFWHHHNKQRLPDDFEVPVYSEDGLRDMRPADMTRIQRQILAPVLRQPVHLIGRDVLRYWYSEAPDREQVTAWIYEFYGDVRFLALTLPRQGRT